MAVAKRTWRDEHRGIFVYLRPREESGDAFPLRSSIYG